MATLLQNNINGFINCKGGKKEYLHSNTLLVYINARIYTT